MTRFMNDMTTIIWTNGEIARKCEFLQGLIDFMEMEEERKGGRASDSIGDRTVL